MSALVDGDLSAVELDRLEQLLLSDPTARVEFREFMQLESLLAWNLGADNEEHGPDPAVGPCGLPPQRRRIATWLLPLAASSLAAMAAAVLVMFALRPSSTAVVLTAADGARWHEGHQLQVGQPLPEGTLGLAAGTAQITFPSGAVVGIHTGAEFEPLGPNRLFLRGGRVTPFVPPAAKGFTVISPGGEIVDFGTEFTVGVDRDGRTDVFVIQGEVDVAGGHVRDGEPVRLTQGFASEFTAAERTPLVTQRPLVIDHFDTADGPLGRKDVDAGQSSRVVDGSLWIPIDGRLSREEPIARVALTNDFSPLVGRRSTIAFKAWLPGGEGLCGGRWLAFVIDDGHGELAKANSSQATAAVLMSPRWQAGMRFSGEIHVSRPFFPRGKGIEGPYQVVITIDDTPETRLIRGGATATLMVNGMEVVSDRPFPLPEHPRLGLHTHTKAGYSGHGFAVVDDFSVSVE